MRFPPFQLERYFALHEFSAQWLLSASDCESLRMESLLALADADASRLWTELSLGYTESQGHALLRAEIAARYSTVTAGEVLVAAPEEAIYLAMHAVLEPGDHVIALRPAYQSLHEIGRSLGCEVTPWPVELEGGAWRLDLERLLDGIRPTTRLIIVNSPHNPTGYLPDLSTYRTIVEMARERGLYLFCDEMYRGLEHEGVQQLPAAADLYERAISLSGLSKTYALPGLRIGWLATKDQAVLAKCTTLKDYITICSSAPSEILGIIALRAADAIISRNRAIIDANLLAAQRFCATYAPWITWAAPRAGSTAFPELCHELPVARFASDLFERHGVLVAPGALFGDDGNRFRVGLGRRNLPEVLEQVGAYLGGLPMSQ